MNTRIVAFAALFVLAVTLAPTGSAHKTTYSEDGKIKIVWGFLNEPAVTMTKTGLDLILTDNATGAPILGAADTLEAHLKYGDDEIHLDDLAARFGSPGSYTQVITLTKAGLYTLALHGTINGSEIDMEIPAAHEVASVEETYFPAADATTGDASALAARVATLESEVAALKARSQTQTSTPAQVTSQPTGGAIPGTAAIGILGVLAAVSVGLAMRRRD